MCLQSNLLRSKGVGNSLSLHFDFPNRKSKTRMHSAYGFHNGIAEYDGINYQIRGMAIQRLDDHFACSGDINVSFFFKQTLVGRFQCLFLVYSRYIHEKIYGKYPTVTLTTFFNDS